MPNQAKRRDIIRQTWLNETYWTVDVNGYKRMDFDIKVLFLIGHPDLLASEVKQYDDILQLNFTESHYMLPTKDNAYFDFIRDKCPQAEFVFKGDDDILVIPENLAYLFEQMRRQNLSSTGCVRSSIAGNVIRAPINKYYVPEEIYSKNQYAQYFSGAAYVLSGALALKDGKLYRLLYIGNCIKKTHLYHTIGWDTIINSFFE